MITLLLALGIALALLGYGIVGAVHALIWIAVVLIVVWVIFAAVRSPVAIRRGRRRQP